MPFDLKSIKGIGVETEKKLTEVSIGDVSKLRKVTETPKKREELSKEIKISTANLYTWSKQAELMKVDGISGDNAALLVACGIRNIEDLKNVDGKSLQNFIDTVGTKLIDVKEIPTLKEIDDWRSNAGTVASDFQTDESDKKNDYIFPSDKGNKGVHSEGQTAKESGFFSDLSEIILDIGIGIAGAQHQLDLSSIEIQNAILKDKELADYGLNATWYAIPEVNFNMKMEYMMVEESTESGSGSVLGARNKRMLISPSNAQYNNIFKSSRTEESSLDLKFVPIPPPEKLTERIIMPNLIGMSIEEAETELAINRIEINNKDIVHEKTGNKESSEVTYQSIEPGKIMLINEKPDLKITLNSEE